MSDDAMKALADRLEEHVLLMANTGTDLSMKNWNTVSNDILLAARTLRAALAPPADDEIEAIRGRHELAEGDRWCFRADDAGRCHRDRATLLRALDAERQRRVEVEKIVIDAAASLAAAISLLERGGERAAPSRKMFDVMITDYNKSLDRARAYFNPRAANITKETP